MRRTLVALLVLLLGGTGALTALATPPGGLPAAPAGALSAPDGGSAPALLPPIDLPSPLPDPPPPVGPTPKPSPKPSSKPSPKPATPPPPPTAAPQDRWALIVGITDYAGNVHDTVGGANDARLVRDVLLRNGWRDDRIRILTDRAATGAAVADGIAWLQANSSSSTFSLFHYSGHVKVVDGHQHLWPADSRFIVDSEVARVLKAIRGTAWTDIAGCHTGGFDDGISSPRHLFTSSSSVSQKSYEDPSTTYSVWAGMLFDESMRQGRADANGDGLITVDEAFAWSAPRAEGYTQNQRPHGAQTPQKAGGSGALDLGAPRI